MEFQASICFFRFAGPPGFYFMFLQNVRKRNGNIFTPALQRGKSKVRHKTTEDPNDRVTQQQQTGYITVKAH